MPEAVFDEKFASTLNPANEASIDVETKSALGLALAAMVNALRV